MRFFTWTAEHMPESGPDMSPTHTDPTPNGEQTEILVAVNVLEEDGYRRYREHMLPLLTAHGGSFGLDVRISEVLRSPEPGPFNRLFTIRFPSREALDAFFSNPGYLEVRAAWFDGSVSNVVRFASYPVVVKS